MGRAMTFSLFTAMFDMNYLLGLAVGSGRQLGCRKESRRVIVPHNVALSPAFPHVACSASLRGELASVRPALPERLHPAVLDRRGCPLGGEERDQSLRRFNLFRSRRHCD